MYQNYIFQFLFKCYFKCICLFNYYIPYKNVTIINYENNKTNKNMTLFFMLSRIFNISYKFKQSYIVHINYKNNTHSFKTFIAADGFHDIATGIETIINGKYKKIMINKNNIILNEVSIGNNNIVHELNNYIYYNTPIYLNTIIKLLNYYDKQTVDIKYYMNFKNTTKTINIAETYVALDNIIRE